MTETLLTISAVKRLADLIVSLSVKASPDTLAQDLIDGWPRNALPIHLARGGILPVTDPVVLISAPPGYGKTSLANQISSARNVIRIDEIETGRDIMAPGYGLEVDPHQVVIIDGIFEPEKMIEIRNTFMRRFAKRNAQLVMCSYFPFPMSVFPGDVRLMSSQEGNRKGLEWDIRTETGAHKGILKELTHNGHREVDDRPNPEHIHINGGILSPPGPSSSAMQSIRNDMENGRIQRARALEYASRMAGYSGWHALHGAMANLSHP